MSSRSPVQTPQLHVGRAGPAAFLFRFLRPTHAKAAVASLDSLTLLFASGKADISFSDIEEVEVRDGWLWAAVRIRASSGVPPGRFGQFLPWHFTRSWLLFEQRLIAKRGQLGIYSEGNDLSGSEVN